MWRQSIGSSFKPEGRSYESRGLLSSRFLLVQQLTPLQLFWDAVETSSVSSARSVVAVVRGEL